MRPVSSGELVRAVRKALGLGESAYPEVSRRVHHWFGPLIALSVAVAATAGIVTRSYGFVEGVILAAAAGYAILFPMPRGGSGYGEAGHRMIVNAWGEGDYKDIMAGVDHLVAQGVADPDRVDIGRALHEDPSVPNYGSPGRGMRFTPGWCLAIEPMFNLGTEETRTLDDGWTVVTADGSVSAHWEHTIAITPDGPWVLTARSDEPARLLAETVLPG